MWKYEILIEKFLPLRFFLHVYSSYIYSQGFQNLISVKIGLVGYYYISLFSNAKLRKQSQDLSTRAHWK